MDRAGFEELMEEQRRRARRAREAEEARGRDVLRLVGELPGTEFVGYDHLEVSARILALVRDDARVESADVEDEVVVFLDRTPFHPAGGGQVGDVGILEGEDFRIQVEDTRELAGGSIAHFGTVIRGCPAVGAPLSAAVESPRRWDVARHHTATHLLHAALREVLGDHIAQAGSLVEPDRLRFDFTHPTAVDSEDLRRVEDYVNARVLEARPVEAIWMDRERALESDVIALFGDTYEECVRVISVEGVSKELCGGNHVENTGQVGMVKILSEESIGSGIRRLEVVAGRAALDWVRGVDAQRRTLATSLGVAPGDLAGRVEDLLEETRQLRREKNRLEARLSDRQAKDMSGRGETIRGITVLAERVEASGADGLREMADSLRDELGECAFVLAAVSGDKVQIVGAATKSAVAKGAHMGTIVRELGSILGGGGGGRPDMAQAGGGRPDLLEEALAQGAEMIARQLGEDGESDEG